MNDYLTVARFLADDRMRTLPIACRLVPLDQWLVTHVDTSWKVKDIKHWILSKCNAWGSSTAPQPPRFRPASPVTFSTPSRRSSLDSGSWEETEEGDDDDWDVFAALEYSKDLHTSDSGLASDNINNTTTSSRVSAPEIPLSTPVPISASTQSFRQQRTSVAPEHAATSARYTLFSFSSGYILEDEAYLAWYRPRPFELLELHRAGAIVPLPRSVYSAYVEPYFESPVLVSERPHGRRPGPEYTQVQVQVQAHAAEWKQRWAIIRNGVLNLCKDASSAPSHKFPIAALCAIGGPEQLGLASKGSSRIICSKFRRTVPAGRGADSDDASSSIPQALGIRKTEGRDDRRRVRGSCSICLEEAVSKMSLFHLDAVSLNKTKNKKFSLESIKLTAYESILRVLHRLAPHPLTSSFLSTVGAPRTPLPSPSTASPISSTSPPSSSILPSTSSSTPPVQGPGPFGVQYPEWRLALCSRARHAGLGDVGPAMTLYLRAVTSNPGLAHFLHHLPRAPSISEGLRRQATAAHSRADSSSASSSVGSGSWTDELDGEDDVESEVEWDGWARDLSRRVERPPLPKLLTISNSSQEPSSGRSGTVSPSSPSSSSEYDSVDGAFTSRARALSYAPHPHQAYTNTPHTSGVRVGRSRSSTVSAATVSGMPASAAAAGNPGESPYINTTTTTTTTITTYVERVPDPLSDPHMAWHAQLRDSEHPSVPRVRASPTPPSPSSMTRNVYGSSSASGSGLASGSASFSAAHAEDRMNGAGTGTGTGAGLGIGGVRRIVRGVSIRNAFNADRFVRGLEDALDFVDGR